MRILLLDTFHPDFIELLRQAGMEVEEAYTMSKQEIMAVLPDYEGIALRSRIPIDQELLQHASRLRFIARGGAGMENIDVNYAESQGIRCLNIPEGNRDALGEHTTGMLLALCNRIIIADREVRNGIWLREENRGMELMGKTIGLIGFGHMGSAFAQRLSGFGVQILAYDKYKSHFGNELVRESRMEELFELADIVSLHIPLTEETHYLADELFFKSFRKNIIFINTARGKNCKTSALVSALQSGKVMGACLDVIEYERSSFERLDNQQLPDAWNYLIQSEQVILSPHIAGWSHESNQKIARGLAQKILNCPGIHQ